MNILKKDLTYSHKKGLESQMFTSIHNISVKWMKIRK